MENLENIQPVLNKNENVIAGPCSAESYEQVMETAKQLYEQGVTIFRAGIWKPRTQPGGFEGIGTIAIPWLKEVKEKYGMKIAIEVANETQATIALNNDINKFKPKLEFNYDDCGKMAIVYNDNQPKIDITDYRGFTIAVFQQYGICLYPTTYNLDIANEYKEFIEHSNSRCSTLLNM